MSHQKPKIKATKVSKEDFLLVGMDLIKAILSNSSQTIPVLEGRSKEQRHMPYLN
jgi:hypothetical protein